jgi:hypothetical protein
MQWVYPAFGTPWDFSLQSTLRILITQTHLHDFNPQPLSFHTNMPQEHFS